MKKIYIAGKISGECETPELMKKCWNKFADYINYLFDNGYSENYEEPYHGLLINSELIKSGKGTWEAYMKNDLTHMINCDEIHMLPDWKDSKGAKIEHDLAVRLGIKVIYVLNFDYLTTSI